MDCSLLVYSVHGILQAKNTGVGCHFLLQGMFPIQELYPGLLHCRQILYRLSYREDNEVLICYLHMHYRCMVLPKLIKPLYLIGFKVKCLYYINTHICKENQPK